jgi:hypothetical protein
VKKGWIEFAPAPEALNDGDWVSHVALSGPPDVEHAELALGGVVVAVWAATAAVVVGAAAADVVVGAGLVVVVEAVVVVTVFFFAAVGVELHAAATRATAPSASANVDQRCRERRETSRPAWLSRARRESAPRCTGSPLKA